MQVAIFKFSQRRLVERFLGRLDSLDIILLDYLWTKISSPSSKNLFKNNNTYTWIKHETILKELPFLQIKERALQKRLKNIVDLGLLLSYTEVITKHGSRTYYTRTKLFESLIFDDVDPDTPTVIPDEEIDEEVEDSWDVPKYVPKETRDVPKYVSVYTPNIQNNKSTRSTRLIDSKIEDKRDNRIGKPEVDEVVSKYNEICTRLSKARSLTPKRKKSIQDILKRHTMDEVVEAFIKVNESDFCCGVNDRGWKADLDFILREDKFVSILEGKYSGKAGVNNTIERGIQSASHRADMNKVREDIANGRAIEF